MTKAKPAGTGIRDCMGDLQSKLFDLRNKVETVNYLVNHTEAPEDDDAETMVYYGLAAIIDDWNEELKLVDEAADALNDALLRAQPPVPAPDDAAASMHRLVSGG